MSDSIRSKTVTDVCAAWLIAIGVVSGLAGLVQFILSSTSEGLWLTLIGVGTTIGGFAIRKRVRFALIPTATVLIAGMTQYLFGGPVVFGFALYQLWRARSEFWPFLDKRNAKQAETLKP